MKPILTDTEMRAAVKHKFYLIVIGPNRQVAYPIAENCQDDAPVYVRVGGKWVPISEGESESTSR